MYFRGKYICRTVVKLLTAPPVHTTKLGTPYQLPDAPYPPSALHAPRAGASCVRAGAKCASIAMAIEAHFQWTALSMSHLLVNLCQII